MTTIRQLTAAFGFEVDTTPIARWNSAINDAKKGARSLNQTNFNELRSSLSGLGGLLNLQLLTPIGAIVAGIGLAKKSFTEFADEEQALSKLKSQLQRFPGSFEDVLKTIDKTRESTGGLISKLEGLSIASRFFEITTSPEAFNKFFDSLTKLSITRGKDVTGIIADAIATGGTQALKELGFTVQELELLTKSGREFSTVGVLQRTRLVEDLLKKAEQRINKDFQDFSLTGAASIKREQAARQELIITMGKQQDVVKEFYDGLSDAQRRFAKNIEKNDSIIFGAISTQVETFKNQFQQTIDEFNKFNKGTLKENDETLKKIGAETGGVSGFLKKLLLPLADIRTPEEIEKIKRDELDQTSETDGKSTLEYILRKILDPIADTRNIQQQPIILKLNDNANDLSRGRIDNGFSSNQIEQKTEIVINSPITINGSGLTERELTNAIRNANFQIYGQAKDMAERTRVVYGRNQK